MAETPMTNAPAAEVTSNIPGLDQAGTAAAAPEPTQTMESVSQPNLTQANLPAYGEPGAPDQPSTVVPTGAPSTPVAPNVPHARLLSMVQGIAMGLSAAGKSLSTGGREGGFEDVIKMRGEQQRQQEEAQQAAQAKKNAEIQNQIAVGTLNQLNSHNIILNAQAKNAMAQSDLQLADTQIETEGKAQQIFDSTGRVPTGWTIDPNTAKVSLAKPGAANASVAAVGTNPPVGTASTQQPAPGTSVYDRRAGILLDAYEKELGEGDTTVAEARKRFADPQAGIEQKQQGLLAVQQKAGLSQQVIKNLTEKADLAVKQQSIATSSRPKDLDDATGRFVVAQQAYKKNPTPDTKQAVDDAKVSQDEFMRVDREKKQIAQDMQNGDPEVIGHALFAGTYAPSQLLSARSMSKPFYSKVIAAANNDAKAAGMPEVLGPNGEHTGQYFNATKAESQYEYSKNIQTQNVLNKIRTLNEKGGDLDILKDAVTALPQMDQKTLNKMFNASATEFGSSAATNYHMALYNVASLLANVQTGGIPTEGEIQQQLDLMNAAYSKGQLAGALTIAKRDIAARGTSMVASNPYLKAAYPDLVTTANQHNVGDRVTLKNGQTVTIKTITPDGNITY